MRDPGHEQCAYTAGSQPASTAERTNRVSWEIIARSEGQRGQQEGEESAARAAPSGEAGGWNESLGGNRITIMRMMLTTKGGTAMPI